ncbi:MAG: M28 family peptidase [Longimicrobiaceae bacterium]
MTRFHTAAALALALLAPAAAAQELPRTHAPRPTTPAITAADLMTRLYILADDSMMGRDAGKRGNVKGTDYIAAQFRRIGLEPAGENGTFFQAVPLVEKGLLPGAALSVDGAPLALRREWVPVPQVGDVIHFGQRLAAPAGVQAVFGGRVGGEMISPEQARGKLVVLLPALGQGGATDYRFWANQRMRWYPEAAGVAVVSLEASPSGLVEYLLEPQSAIAEQGPTLTTPGAGGMLLSAAAARRVLGADPATLAVGAAGRTVTGAFQFGERPTEAPARNVIGVLRGSDPALRGQYVMVSAHNDHVGLTTPVDHDSVRAFNRVMRPAGANDDPGPPTAEQAARISAIRDSLRRVHGGVRMDSVMNGADDDGSGTVTLLEIAEYLASRPHPRRSILFMSHTAEEKGLYGSQWFTDHPTVPRDSLVAALNMDMVGRGRPEEVRGGGPYAIQMIGSRRLSTQLGALIDSLNAQRPNRMQVDYSWDAAGHPANRYCRSDHYMYARYGIPITYFSAGYHVDYHQVGDEPQYIWYDHMAHIGEFVRDVAVAVANRPQRLVVDRPKPNPNAPCRQ